MTDDERLADPVAAARALPPGSLVLVRACDSKRRAELAAELLRIAQPLGLVVLIAGDPALAVRLGADGLHLSAARAHEVPYWRARHPRFRISCAAHSLDELLRASRFSADAIFLSPVFPTRSHPDRSHLTPLRASFIAHAASVPVYALGGVDESTASRLPPAFAGIAAIGALAV